MNKLKNFKIEEIILFLFIFLPLAGGRLTKTDISVIPLFLGLLIIFKNNYFILKGIIKLILVFGISQIILNSFILNNFFSLTMVKGILIFISPSVIYFSCKYVLLKRRKNILFFGYLIDLTLIFNLLLNFFPIINNNLSNILFLNRLNTGVINTAFRGDINVFGEPSFRAIFIAGIAMIIISLKDIIYTNKVKYYMELILSLFLILSTKSATSIPIIFIVFIYFISTILEDNKRLFSHKIVFYFFTTLSTIGFLVNRAFNYENARIINFLRYFTLLNDNEAILVDLISLDASIMQRIINYDLFIRNFPFNIKYFFGLTKENYADISFQHASNYLIGPLNYDILIDLTKGDGNYFRAQTTALPSFFFNYGTIPTILLILTMILICIELVKSNKKFSTIPIILYLVFSLLMGPSILFSMPYLLILTIIYKSNRVEDLLVIK